MLPAEQVTGAVGKAKSNSEEENFAFGDYACFGTDEQSELSPSSLRMLMLLPGWGVGSVCLQLGGGMPQLGRECHSWERWWFFDAAVKFCIVASFEVTSMGFFE